MPGVLDVIWGVRKQEYFCKEDWTGGIRLIRFNKFGRARKRRSGVFRRVGKDALAPCPPFLLEPRATQGGGVNITSQRALSTSSRRTPGPITPGARSLGAVVATPRLNRKSSGYGSRRSPGRRRGC